MPYWVSKVKKKIGFDVLLVVLSLVWSALAFAVSAPETLCVETSEATKCVGVASDTGAGPRHRPRQFHPGHYMSLGPGTGAKAIQAVGGISQIVGVKKQYYWVDIEPARDAYDFSSIRADLEMAKKSGKRFWLQVAYTQFNGSRGPLTPKYMWRDKEYGCGPEYYGTYVRDAQKGGWLPCKWNGRVAERYIALWQALAAEFGSSEWLEGVSLGETAVDTAAAKKQGLGFSASALETNMKRIALAVKKAYPDKVVMQMTNFAPYDLNDYAVWLVENGIGIGGPDVKLSSSLLLDVTYPLYRKYHSEVPTGPDVQWGNYDKLTVSELLDEAITLTNPWYVFWLKREPYFTDEVIPLASKRALPAASEFYD